MYVHVGINRKFELLIFGIFFINIAVKEEDKILRVR